MTSLRVLNHAYRAWRRNRRGVKHEPEVAFLDALLPPAPVCLHVGASDGRHAYATLQVRPHARVLALEPSPFSFQVLQTVIRWHRLQDRIVAANAAAGDHEGELLLVTPIKSSGRLGRAFAYVAEAAPDGQARPELEDRGVETARVPVVTLDAFAGTHGTKRVDFVRMDIEGAEQQALDGAAELMARDRPHVLIEIHPIMLRERFGGSAEAVVGRFLHGGYRMFRVDAGAVSEVVSVDAEAPWKDYFFVHPSRAAELPPGVFRDRFAA